MAVFPSFKLTKKGEELLNRCIGEGKVLTFTKFKIGDGVPTGDWRDSQDIAHSFKEFPVTSTSVQENQTLRIKGYFDNKGFAEDKKFKEIGVFVSLAGEYGEFLYSYTNAGDTGDIIPAESRGFYSRTLDVANYIGYATNITFNIEQVIDNYDFNTEAELKVATFLKKGDKIRLWGRLALGDIKTRFGVVTDTETSLKIDNGLYVHLTGNIVVDDIEQLKVLNGVLKDDLITINGYYNADDGATHKRVIAQTDDGSGVQLTNGLWANMIHEGEINVSWFGAKGDGKTDDTVVIQKAVDYIGVKGGGVVNFKEGTYMINATEDKKKKGGIVVNHDNIAINLKKSTLKVIPSSATHYNTIIFVDCNNGLVENGTILGDRDEHIYPEGTGTHEFGHGITTLSAHYITIKDLIIKNTTGDGVNIFGRNNTGDGYKPSTNITVENNVVDNVRRNGIDLGPSAYCKIINNIVRNTKGAPPEAGIDIESGDCPRFNIIANNIFENNKGEVNLFTANNTVVENNTFINDTLLVQLSSNSIISNNIFNGKCGIVKTTSSGSTTYRKGRMIPVGSKCKIVSQKTVDFTTVGSPNNTIGTEFYVTKSLPLGEGDELERVIENITIIGNSIQDGNISIYDFPNAIISNNTIDACGRDDGIRVGTTVSCEVTNNIIKNSKYPIKVDNNVTEIVCKDNIINNGMYEGVLIKATKGIVSGNLITDSYVDSGSAHTGTAINAHGNILVANNKIISTDREGKTVFAQAVQGRDGVIIEGNYISGKYGETAISLYGDSSAIGNVIDNLDSRCGIKYDSPTNVKGIKISKNIITFNKETSSTGIDFVYNQKGENIIVSDNEIYSINAMLKTPINTTNGSNTIICKNIVSSGRINSNPLDKLIGNVVVADANLSALNTPIMQYVMDKEGGTVKEDYLNYSMDKIIYDKKIDKYYKDKQKAYNEALEINPNLTYEEFIQNETEVDRMMLSEFEEPQVPESVKKFMEKYL